MGYGTLKPIALSACLGMLMSLGSVAMAHDPDGEHDSLVPADAANDVLSASASIKFLNERNARGMVLEDQGLITQGSLGVNIKVAENLTIITGVWTDIHSTSDGPGPSASAAGAGTSSSSGLDAFYEFDWWIGISTKIGELNITAYYEEFLNPADDFASQTGGFESEHVQVVLTWDGLGDDFIGDIDLKPYARFLIEADGKVGSGVDQGVYLELGIAPSFVAVESEAAPITVTIPVIVGMGFEDFYEDNTVGFVTVGAHASTPFRLLPEGNWTLDAGVDLIMGNDNAVGSFNSGVAGQSNDTRVVFSIGISGSF